MQPQASTTPEASEGNKDQPHEPPPQETVPSGAAEVQTMATTTEEGKQLDSLPTGRAPFRVLDCRGCVKLLFYGADCLEGLFHH